jgi:serine/threonine protein kinase
MALDTVSDFVDSLRNSRLLEPAQQNALASDLLPHFAETKALAGELIRRGWLTPYQANLLLQGRGCELLLASYVLLERIGEGGMGQVFKAKNWKLGRIVALKLIRKERLANEDAVRRFHREIRAAAQLSHPNIVMAYDADEVNGTHFFAMECVEGSDLAKLIKQHGPMPVAQACDWIRQAALGLQHAHERGMVHRDIKPHNLLLTKQGVVKILDMGLARLTVAGEDGDISTTMTQEGAVMGTPDYMAPEQAEESHTVDIRADLYSLGCTLYQLLAGKVPFPGGTLIQKLKKHQSEQPAPIEMLQPDVPTAVADLVYKLMAKRPQERYPTPAELVRALETLPSEDGRTLPSGAPVGANLVPTEPTVNEVLDFRPTGETVQALMVEQRSRRRAEKRKLLLAAVGGGVLLVGLAVALWLLMRRSDRSQPETQPVIAEQPKVRKEDKRSFEQWLRDVAKLPPEKQVEAVGKKLQELNPGFDGKVTPQIDNGVVTSLKFVTDDVTRLSPVQALTGLQSLCCNGSAEGKGKLVDLSPLKDMKLTELNCADTKVSDLSPLRAMKLTGLQCFRTPVADLSPLKDMKLTGLNCSGTKVSDLSPLKDMKPTYLNCIGTPVADLSPLIGMPLSEVWISRTQVRDLAPLRGMPLQTLDCSSMSVGNLAPLAGMPLKKLYCDFKPERDAAILRSIKSLETINGKPADEFWKDVDTPPTP